MKIEIGIFYLDGCPPIAEAIRNDSDMVLAFASHCDSALVKRKPKGHVDVIIFDITSGYNFPSQLFESFLLLSSAVIVSVDEQSKNFAIELFKRVLTVLFKASIKLMRYYRQSKFVT